MSLEADVKDFLELRQTVRVAAVALLLVAGFAALSGAVDRGAVMALTGIGMLAAVRSPRARPNRRPAVPATV